MMSYQELFDIIEDDSSRPDEIDDAIMYLGDYGNEEVVNYLLEIAHKNLEDYMLSSVGESLARIFVESRDLYKAHREEIKKLPLLIQQEISAIIS